ncbi:MAG TPA: hypothetical protein VGE77_05255, partial [Nocardioides sp.]
MSSAVPVVPPAPSVEPAGPIEPTRPPEPGVLDAVTLLLEVADELVVRSARDTHRAVAARVGRLVGPATHGIGHGPVAAHDAVAAGVYGAIG